jgi:flagellar biosynthesis protein FliQ
MQGLTMELIQGILGAVVTIVALVVMICLVAGLFMIIFGIATGIDDQIQG